MNPRSTDCEADALTTTPSRSFAVVVACAHSFVVVVVCVHNFVVVVACVPSFVVVVMCVDSLMSMKHDEVTMKIVFNLHLLAKICRCFSKEKPASDQLTCENNIPFGRKMTSK